MSRRQLSTTERIAAPRGPARSLPMWIQLRRPDAVHRYALRRQQQLDSFKNVRQIVGNQYTNLFLLTGNGSPPLRRTSRRRLRLSECPESKVHIENKSVILSEAYFSGVESLP